MPQTPPPQTAQERPDPEPLAHPVIKTEFPHNGTATVFETYRGDGQSTTAGSEGTKSHHAPGRPTRLNH